MWPQLGFHVMKKKHRPGHHAGDSVVSKGDRYLASWDLRDFPWSLLVHFILQNTNIWALRNETFSNRNIQITTREHVQISWKRKERVVLGHYLAFPCYYKYPYANQLRQRKGSLCLSIFEALIHSDNGWECVVEPNRSLHRQDTNGKEGRDSVFCPNQHTPSSELQAS